MASHWTLAQALSIILVMQCVACCPQQAVAGAAHRGSVSWPPRLFLRGVQVLHLCQTPTWATIDDKTGSSPVIFSTGSSLFAYSSPFITQWGRQAVSYFIRVRSTPVHLRSRLSKSRGVLSQSHFHSWWRSRGARCWSQSYLQPRRHV